MSQTKQYRQIAAGEKPADIVLKHCKLVNVLSGEIEEDVDIALAGSEIVGVGHGYEGARTIDVAGRFVYPGLIDAHIHLESTKLTIPEAGRLMARFGTAAVITDPHEIANVAGMSGVAYQMDAAKSCGFIEVFFTAPSCVPALPDAAIETYPSELDAEKLDMMRNSDHVVGLGEVMNVPGITSGNPQVVKKIETFQNAKLAVDGHAPMVSEKQLNTCVYMGIQSDHESTSLDEAREKLRRGMFIMIREGSSEHNLDDLIGLVNPRNASRMMFASDDLEATDLMRRGHVNYMVKRAVQKGVDPIIALQMATINPARYFGIADRVGAIVAGAQANLVVSRDLQEFTPDFVVHKGQVVFKNGQTLNMNKPFTQRLHPTMNTFVVSNISVQILMDRPSQARLIDIVPGQILTRESVFAPLTHQGLALPNPEIDTAKICVFDRHTGSGRIGLGFVRGFGIRFGAIGSSVAHDSHNLIVVGVNDEDILKCVEVIQSMKGGQAAVFGPEVVALPLPVAGLMSEAPYEKVIDREYQIEDFCKNRLGIKLPKPMAALSFLSLPVIPQIRMTDQGLIKIEPGGYPQKVDLFV